MSVAMLEKVEKAEKKKDATIPLSAFDNGNAAAIFAEIRKTGSKVVVNDEDGAECVIMSPEDYVKMSDELFDYQLIELADERMAHFDPSKLIPAEEVYRELGITDEDLEGWEDVELE